jgi:hypothetical protein
MTLSFFLHLWFVRESTREMFGKVGKLYAKVVKKVKLVDAGNRNQ